MKGFKGYNKGLTCRGKQYKENETFTEEKAEICQSGMHFCVNPFDVLDYYGFVNPNTQEINDFTEVEALEPSKTDDAQKYTTTKLKVGAKLTIPAFVGAFVEFTLEKIKKEETATNTGNFSAATNTGYQSIAVSWGYKGKARGAKGCYLVLAEYGNNGDLINAKMEKVDGEKIKENTFYILENGEFKEVI